MTEPDGSYVNQDPDLPRISSHLPDLVDQYISVRAQRLALDKQSAEIKELEDNLNKTIIAKMRDEGMSVLGARNGFVKMKEYEEPVAQEWNKLYPYIVEHNAFELLHKRISTLAVKERWEAGEEIPGVVAVKMYKLTVSKS